MKASSLRPSGSKPNYSYCPGNATDLYRDRTVYVIGRDQVQRSMMYLHLLYSSSKKIGLTYSVLRALSTQQCRGDSWISRGKGKPRLYSNINGRGASGDSVPSADSSIGGPSGDRGMNVFDRKAKRWHKNRAAMAPDADTFDYLRYEVLR